MKKNRIAVGQTKVKAMLALKDPLQRQMIKTKAAETVSKALAAKSSQERFDAVDIGLHWLQQYLRNEIGTKLWHRASDEQCDIWGSSIFYLFSREIEYHLLRAGKFIDGPDDNLRLLLAPTEKQMQRIKMANFTQPLFVHPEDDAHLLNLPKVRQLQEVQAVMASIRDMIGNELHEVMNKNDSQGLILVKDRVRLQANGQIDNLRPVIQSQIDGVSREEMGQIIFVLRREVYDFIEKVIVDFGELTDYSMLAEREQVVGLQMAETMVFHETGNPQPSPSPTTALEEEQPSTQRSKESIMKINAPITSLFTNTAFLQRWSALVAEVEAAINSIKAKAENRDEFVSTLKTEFVKHEVLMSRVYAIIGESSGETYDPVEVTELAAKLLDRQVLVIEPLAQIHAVDITELLSQVSHNDADRLIEKAKHAWLVKVLLFAVFAVIAGLFGAAIGAGVGVVFFYTQRFVVPFLARYFTEANARLVYQVALGATTIAVSYFTGLSQLITKTSLRGANAVARFLGLSSRFETQTA